MVCEGIAAGRNLSIEQVEALINEAPFSVAKARQQGLIDDIGYEDGLNQTPGSSACRASNGRRHSFSWCTGRSRTGSSRTSRSPLP